MGYVETDNVTGLDSASLPETTNACATSSANSTFLPPYSPSLWSSAAQFTGAARELRDALLVNPYDIDQSAEAIRVALEMEPEEKQLRVHRMRPTHQRAQHLPVGRQSDHGTR